MKYLILILGVLGIVFSGAGNVKAADSCVSPDECGNDEYCAKATGDCEGKGMCRVRPELCPDVWDPVCGCDGVTYGNVCEAAAVGVSVDYGGECRDAYCWSNDMCQADEYCFFEVCAAETGVCSPRPEACPDVWDPVCGCDGITYSNSCYAAMAGMSVDYEGECRDAYCWSNEMCQVDEYCFFEVCAAETGVCSPRPEACPDVWDPVCGCDGITYSNACYAAMVGMSVDYEGECAIGPCTSNAECGADEYCAKAVGGCEGEGVCSPRPTICPTLWDPVCGCDGRTYPNSCVAAVSGVNVDYKGECGAGACRSSDDCDRDEYCAKDIGDCDGQGQCEQRPEACPRLWDPVCGCDGRTYSNACFAAMAGESIDYAGECEPVTTPCNDNNDCGSRDYCAKEAGDCDGEGMCQPRPEVCPDVWDPVCGCDGMTYSNSCYAARAGVNLDYDGQCEPVTTLCRSNSDCGGEDYCAKEPGDCEGEGACQPRPELCIDVWDPVCGCDGVTYSNACYAARAGVSVDYEGQCEPVTVPCNSNDDCGPQDYCAKDTGDCDGEGVCEARSDACIALWDPVCACDGVTYSNSCSAAMAGVSVDYRGQCGPVVTECDSNNDCEQGNYCAKNVGDCDGEGTCQARPQACPAVWAPVCGCDGRTYSNACCAAMAGVSVDYDGDCLPSGPTIVMREPRVKDDDVHSGPSGVKLLRILWSEPVVFGAADITVVNEDGVSVGFAATGSSSTIMSIGFTQKLLYDRYTITISDSVASADTGNAIDGDGNGAAGGGAVITMEHRMRSDFDNNNEINMLDFAAFAETWLASLD